MNITTKQGLQFSCLIMRVAILCIRYLRLHGYSCKCFYFILYELKVLNYIFLDITSSGNRMNILYTAT